MNERQFGAFFVPTISGMVIGSFASGRMAGRIQPRTGLMLGYGLMLIAGISNVAYTQLVDVMVGRPALRNPWIFAQAAALEAGQEPFAPSGHDVVAYLEEAALRIGAAFDGRPIGRLKEIARYIGRAVPDDFAFQREALRAQDVAALLEVARRHLGELSSEQLDLRADGHLGLEQSGRAERGQASEHAA